jgi:hypothetical protein
MISASGSRHSIVRNCALALIAIGGAASASVAYGQATIGETAQTLDRVDIIYSNDADNIFIDTEEANRPWKSEDYQISGTSFTQCQNTAARGIYCLDGNTVKRFPNPSDTPAQSISLFDCSNSAFRFNNRAACDTLTVDITGTIWLAAAKGQRFSLFKVIQTNTAPDSSWIRFTTTAGTFFTREYATGRPQLKDLAVIDGDVAAAFPLSNGVGGVIAVEQKAEVTFFPDIPGATPILLGDATTWGLTRDSRGKLTEEVQSATLLQTYIPPTPGVTPADDVTRNWLLITTSAGRLVSREIPWNAPLPPITNHTVASLAASPAVATACGQTAFYDIQTSVKSRSIYVTDRRGCRALALTTNIDGDFTKSTPLTVYAPVVIASTSPLSGQATLQAPPEGVSIAPGIALSMAKDCPKPPEGSPPTVCPLVGDGDATDGETVPAASMSNVQLYDGSPDGLFVFQIKNIPDCRYFNTLSSPPPGACLASNVMFKADGSSVTYGATGNVPDPHKVFLNVRPLLPLEVTRAKALPLKMLLSPRYKALKGTNTFDALFGIAENGVRFKETFEANFDLVDLLGEGIKLGCGGEDLPSRLIDTTAGPQWDIVVTISEDFTTVGGLTNGGRQHTDMLVNSDGCDPTDPPAAGTRWSMFAYGLRMAPDLDVVTTTGTTVRYSDSVLAKLTLSLFKDLGETIDTYACLNNDPGGAGEPVSADTCTTLKANWFNTNDKLTKCVESSTQPLNSTEIRTCNAFEVQYAPFAALVNGLVKSPTASDPANRVGELKARLEVFRYVYDSQFKPSIPADTGFNDPL